eukprot:1643070-Pyramimonas_sp.AAC.1
MMLMRSTMMTRMLQMATLMGDGTDYDNAHVVGVDSGDKDAVDDNDDTDAAHDVVEDSDDNDADDVHDHPNGLCPTPPQCL